MDEPVARSPMKTAKTRAPRKGVAVQAAAPTSLAEAGLSLPADPTPPAVPPALAATAPAVESSVPDVPIAAPEAPVAVQPDVVDVAAPAPEATSPVAPSPVAPIVTAPATTTHAVKDTIMETIENVTHNTQNAFNDVSERAKGAVDKSQKLFEDANEFGKGNVEALVESSKIAARGFEALSQDAAAYAKKSFEEATAAAKTMTSVKSPTELLKLQSDYARSAFDALVQQTSHNTEAMLKLVGEVVQPLSNRVALAAEKMKVVA